MFINEFKISLLWTGMHDQVDCKKKVIRDGNLLIVRAFIINKCKN